MHKHRHIYPIYSNNFWQRCQGNSMRIVHSFQQIMLEQLDTHIPKEFQPLPYATKKKKNPQNGSLDHRPKPNN